MLAYLQKWAGYFLTGDTREEGLMFVHGPGGSGKSTFVRVLSEILGSYSRACNMDAFTNRDRAEHSTEIAKLAGARLVTATETDAGAKWNEPRIKQLTGRDKIAARFMRQDEFEFMPTFKIIIAGNHRPGLKTVGEEMRRRIHLIEFPDSLALDERNNQLPEQLRAEYPAILRWMIEGCLEWQRHGLGKPERVIDDTEQYLQAQDVLGAWISEHLERSNSSTRVSECHRSYTTYAREQGEFEPSMTRFSEDMQARGWVSFKSSVKFFKNCTLKSPVINVFDYTSK
jgi:P4 family phage/plasmid primase-like protien